MWRTSKNRNIGKDLEGIQRKPEDGEEGGGERVVVVVVVVGGGGHADTLVVGGGRGCRPVALLLKCPGWT